MKLVSTSLRPTLRFAGLGLCIAVAAGLAGCYVVPIQPGSTPPPPVIVAAPQPAAPAPIVIAPPQPLNFTARLYPANDIASSFGMVLAVVTNDLNGRGHFSTNIGGEAFSGEATRAAGSGREGSANGAGQRGGYIHCRYTMNSPTLGSGSCRMASGAVFNMHIGG